MCSVETLLISRSDHRYRYNIYASDHVNSWRSECNEDLIAFNAALLMHGPRKSVKFSRHLKVDFAENVCGFGGPTEPWTPRCQMCLMLLTL